VDTGKAKRVSYHHPDGEGIFFDQIGLCECYSGFLSKVFKDVPDDISQTSILIGVICSGKNYKGLKEIQFSICEILNTV